MPDLATHILFNAISGRFFRAKENMTFFIAGAVLPDLLTRVPASVLPQSSLNYFFLPLHSPLPLLVVNYAIVLFFPARKRKSCFWWLNGGVLLHLLADSLQIHMGPGYYWLYPFSWSTYHWGLFWPEASLYLLPFLVIIFLLQTVFSFPKQGVRSIPLKKKQL